MFIQSSSIIHASNLDRVYMKVIMAVLIDKSMSNRSVMLGPVLRCSSTRLTSQQLVYLGGGGLSINMARASSFISGNSPSDMPPTPTFCPAIALEYPHIA